MFTNLRSLGFSLGAVNFISENHHNGYVQFQFNKAGQAKASLGQFRQAGYKAHHFTLAGCWHIVQVHVPCTVGFVS